MVNGKTSTPLIFNRNENLFVRELNNDKNGFVEFLFGIGTTDLMVELILPKKAFTDFCLENKVIKLTREEIEIQDSEQQKWKYGSPGIQE
ncbi:phenol hydroxylase subunit [Zhongshania marina]|uniref:Phenol hydroxylase n=1 Tax=Zhongshania marina TaxID=2304603 RepID=A0A2S4HKG9_9GAMM|nr:phenol hydroxylase subunit [Marortus luteolus]POP54486.1 phenol hydroxylase [Marortus luteolus]